MRSLKRVGFQSLVCWGSHMLCRPENVKSPFVLILPNNRGEPMLTSCFVVSTPGCVLKSVFQLDSTWISSWEPTSHYLSSYLSNQPLDHHTVGQKTVFFLCHTHRTIFSLVNVPWKTHEIVLIMKVLLLFKFMICIHWRMPLSPS